MLMAGHSFVDMKVFGVSEFRLGPIGRTVALIQHLSRLLAIQQPSWTCLEPLIKQLF